MKFFREIDGRVWAFEINGSQDESITPTMVAMTLEEIEAHLNPPPSIEELAAIETLWRDQQMPIARNNVTAIQFGDEDVPGTEQDWKEYWLALRKWTTDNPDFPDMNKRPIQPS